MNKIIQLSPHVANQIAAGEVVERPISAIKELIENSIDADAGQINVRIKGGGLEHIIVEDDGHGIDEVDFMLAVTRYATSKLKTVTDLNTIATLGFRGEALASIASISDMVIMSKTIYQEQGHKALIKTGVIADMGFASIEKGTRIEVRNLFYNVPARLKFQKSKRALNAEIEKMMRAFAFIYPQIGFQLFIDDQKIFAIEKHQETRVYRGELLLGPHTKNLLYPVEVASSKIALSGVIAAPSLAAKDSRNVHWFVNNRLITDRKLTQATYVAFRTLLEKGFHPVTALHLEMAPNEVDVNVHPRKSEVRFSDEHGVLGQVIDLLSGFLSTTPWQNGSQRDEILPKASYFPRPDPYNALLPRPKVSYSIPPSLPREQLRFTVPKNEVLGQEVQGQAILKGRFLSDLRIIGQLNQTYLLLEHEEGLVVVDQHAAHERVRFEQLRKDSDDFMKTEVLLFPIVVELDFAEMSLFKEHQEDLNGLGLDVESLSENSIVLRAVPTFLNRENLPAMVRELIRDFSTTGRTDSGVKALEDVLATLACHSSVRAGQKLSHEEMAFILKELDGVPFNAHCPHGRPIAKRIEPKELQKWFDRI